MLVSRSSTLRSHILTDEAKDVDVLFHPTKFLVPQLECEILLN